ncbi:hypothetical protein C8F01DRAFT_1252395 [Mycena amicta]|nr:hypothetical protein C8F01DRAFT_1252395 [Mycena amicta]
MDSSLEMNNSSNRQDRAFGGTGSDYYPRGMDNNQNQERLGSSLSTNDFSFRPRTTDNVGSGGGNFKQTTDSSNRTQFDTYGATPSIGGTEKLTGKMKGNADLQERGQERKVGEFDPAGSGL